MTLPPGPSAAILRSAREGFGLRLGGVHGEAHWLRVRAVGLDLAKETGADPLVVEAFALLHDVKRRHNGADFGHGVRSADYAVTLPRDVLPLSPSQLSILLAACRDHEAGLIAAETTVATCWDADRLDLWRVGIRPDPRLLCTEAARDPARIRAARYR